MKQKQRLWWEMNVLLIMKLQIYKQKWTVFSWTPVVSVDEGTEIIHPRWSANEEIHPTMGRQKTQSQWEIIIIVSGERATNILLERKIIHGKFGHKLLFRYQIKEVKQRKHLRITNLQKNGWTIPPPQSRLCSRQYWPSMTTHQTPEPD